MSWLDVADEGRVRWLTIDRPERKNAIPLDGWSELGQALSDFEAAPARVLVITGSGGDFCSGADLDPESIDSLASARSRYERMRLIGDVALTLHRLHKPTIAAVDGAAVGAGMNLALGCDVVVATTRARFAELFVRRGLTVDFGGTWLLPRVVGLQRAKELALSGRFVEADEALRIGLVMELVEPASLRDRVTALARSFLDGAPVAQGFTKQALNSSFETGLTEALAQEGQSQTICLSTEDLAEGVAAFFGKRPPVWKGR